MSEKLETIIAQLAADKKAKSIAKASRNRRSFTQPLKIAGAAIGIYLLAKTVRK